MSQNQTNAAAEVTEVTEAVDQDQALGPVAEAAVEALRQAEDREREKKEEQARCEHVVTTGLNSLLRNPLWSMNFLTNVLANLSFAVRSTAIRTQEDQTRLVGTEDFVAGPCFRVVTGEHPADETPVVEVCNNSTTALEEAVFAVMDESGEKHARLASAVRLIASAYGYNPAANREFYVTQSTVIEAVARENLNEIMDDLRESLMPEVK